MNLSLRMSLLLTLALFSSHTFASWLDCCEPICQPTCLPPIYLGATLGLTSLADDESTINPILDRHYLGSSGFLGGILIGYNFNRNKRWKFDVEAFITDTSLNSTAKQNFTPITTYKINMRYNLGLRILPGYEFTPGTEGHLILGYSLGQFDISDNGNFGIIEQEFSTHGFQAGLSLETIVLGSFSIRTDALYTVYSGKTSNGITTSIPPSIQTYRNRLSTLEGNVTLIYRV